MKKRLLIFKGLFIVLLMSSFPMDSLAKTYTANRESFTFYYSSGAAVPLGKAADKLKPGFHFSTGVGIMLSSQAKITSELNIRFSFNRLKTKSQDTYVSGLSGTYKIPDSHENTNYLSFEGRFKVENYRRLRPYFTVGFGFTSSRGPYPYGVSILGVGVDVATTSKGARPLYSELRLMIAENTYIVYCIGVRIG